MKNFITCLLVLSMGISFSVNAAQNYSYSTTIKQYTIYPQPVTPNGVQYVELIVNIPGNMTFKPACAAHAHRFLIDSDNPLFPYIYSMVMKAKDENLTVSINYWDACEKSGTHRAPLIRALTIK